MNNHQWCSLETWFRSRDPFLRVSVSQVSGLETLNIAKKWLSEISIIQQLLFVVFAGKKLQSRSEKCQKFEKKINLEVMTTFFVTKIGKMQKFWSPESRSRDFWWSLGLEVLTRSRSRRLRSRLHHWSSYFYILELTLLNAVIVA